MAKATKIRFADESSNQVIVLESDPESDAQYSLDPESDAQYSLDPSDFRERRERRQQEAENCKQRDYAVLLDDCFQDPVAHVQRQINLFCQLPSSDPDDQATAATPRGLEGRISRKHDQERKEARTKCIQDVLVENDKLRFRFGTRLSEEEIWQSLCKVSREASRTSRRFARRLGKADALVVQLGEIDDSNKAASMINDIKAEKMKKSRGSHTRHSTRMHHGGSRRASYSGSTTTYQTMVASAGRNLPSKSASDRCLGLALQSPLEQLELDFDQTARTGKTPVSRLSSSSPERDSTKRRWSSFKKVGKEDAALPKSPKEHRGLLKRCYSWSMGNGSSNKDLKQAQSLSDHVVPTQLPSDEIAVCPLDNQVSESLGYSANSGEIDNNDDMSEMGDSILFNRKRTRKSASSKSPRHPIGPPALLATLDEVDQSWNDSTNHNSQKSNAAADDFLSRWAGGNHVKAITGTGTKTAATPKFLNESFDSLDLTDLRLVTKDDDDDDDDSITFVNDDRDGDDWKPKSPPATRWDSSWSALDVMEDSLTMEESPVSKARPTRKTSQLQKAEQWAMQRSCPRLASSSSSRRSEGNVRVKKTTATGRGHFPEPSGWKSTSALLDTTDPKQKSEKKRGGKLRKLLNLWSSKSSLTVAEEEKSPKMPLTRHTKPEKKRQNGKRDTLARHSSTPVLFASDGDSRKGLVRTPSGLTADSNSSSGSGKSLRKSFRDGFASFASFKKSKVKERLPSGLRSQSFLLQHRVARC